MFAIKYREQLLQVPGLYEELDAFYRKLNAFLRTAHHDDGSLINEAPAQISDLGLAVGSIVPYAGTSIPAGWMLCDGTALSRGIYRALFMVIGTTYGVGDGASTFNLPDLRGRFPLGTAAAGTGSTLGATGGALDHTHTVPVTGAPSATTTVQSGAGATVASSTHTHTVTGGVTDTANPPFLALRYIILYA